MFIVTTEFGTSSYTEELNQSHFQQFEEGLITIIYARIKDDRTIEVLEAVDSAAYVKFDVEYESPDGSEFRFLKMDKES